MSASVPFRLELRMTVAVPSVCGFVQAETPKFCPRKYRTSFVSPFDTQVNVSGEGEGDGVTVGLGLGVGVGAIVAVGVAVAVAVAVAEAVAVGVAVAVAVAVAVGEGVTPDFQNETGNVTAIDREVDSAKTPVKGRNKSKRAHLITA